MNEFSQSKIHRVACEACKQIFIGVTLEQALAKHEKHVSECETIKALEKFFEAKAKFEKILEQKLSIDEAADLMGVRLKK